MSKLEELMNSPQVQVELEKILRREARATRLTTWMKRIPVLGYYIRSFWFLIITEGPKATIKPRWGGLTFAFLNDGQGATVWHTWHSITEPHGEFAGIYVDGAPKSRKQAQEWDAKWAKERKERRTQRLSPDLTKQARTIAREG